MVLLLAWDRVFKIKDAFENKQYKPNDTQELFRELFDDVQNIHEDLAEYINTPGWNRPCGDEHLDTIPKKESNEFIKSSVEDLVPNPSEFEDECECDVPDCDDSQTTNFSTFSNPLFDNSTSSDDESSHEEVTHEMSFKTYSNPLFNLDEEIISSEFNPIHNEDLDSTPKNDCFDTDSYLFESSLNRDTLMISSLKIDSLLAELAGELIFLESLPSGIDEASCDPEEDIHLVERLLYENSSPRPPKEFVSKNSNADIKSFSPSLIPVEDSGSHMEEIDLSFTLDNPMPPSIEDDDDDSERDILILEELLDKYSLSLPENESFYFDTPLFSRPPAKPPDVWGNWVKFRDLKQALRGRHTMLISSLVFLGESGPCLSPSVADHPKRPAKHHWLGQPLMLLRSTYRGIERKDPGPPLGDVDSEIAVLKSKLEKTSKEKDDIKIKIKKFENASQSLDKLIGSQITNKSKRGLGYVSYNAIPHLHTGSVKIFEPVKENNDAPLIEEWELEGEDEVKSPLEIKRKIVKPSVDKVEVDIPKQNDKPARRPVKYTKMYITQRPRGRPILNMTTPMVTWHLRPPSELVLGELGPDSVALVWILDMLPLPYSDSKLEALVLALPNPSCISLVMASSRTLVGTLD
nr:hypothetical protein GQ55_9G274100 [Tanacetum cinerariifolium]